MVVPEDQNGPEKFLSPVDVAAIPPAGGSHLRGDAGANTPTILPVT